MKRSSIYFRSIKNVNSYETRYGCGEFWGKCVSGYSIDTAGQEHFFHPGQFENTLRIEFLYTFEISSFYGQVFKIKILKFAIASLTMNDKNISFPKKNAV